MPEHRQVENQVDLGHLRRVIARHQEGGIGQSVADTVKPLLEVEERPVEDLRGECPAGPLVDVFVDVGQRLRPGVNGRQANGEGQIFGSCVGGSQAARKESQCHSELEHPRHRRLQSNPRRTGHPKACSIR